MRSEYFSSSRNYVACLLAFIVAGLTNVALASHDANIIHACSKSKTFRVVNSADDCKDGEVAVALATEEALNALQGSATDLQAQIDALNVLARRLHGNQAAVIDDFIGAGKSPGTPGGYLITLTFCEESVGIALCDSTTGTVLTTPLITDAQEGTIITFNAGNAADFDLVVDLLTNGENDIIMIETNYQRGDGTGGGGGGITAQDSFYLFRKTQTTSGPGFDDLTGLEIDRVDIAIDRVLLAYDSTNDETSIDIEYRIFFGLAP